MQSVVASLTLELFRTELDAALSNLIGVDLALSSRSDKVTSRGPFQTECFCTSTELLQRWIMIKPYKYF